MKKSNITPLCVSLLSIFFYVMPNVKIISASAIGVKI